MSEWHLHIPDLDGPQLVGPPAQPIPGRFRREKILHLSDPHVQKDYEVTSRRGGAPLRMLTYSVFIFASFSSG